jgi:uncharacterized protein (DUF1786 family)
VSTNVYHVATLRVCHLEHVNAWSTNWTQGLLAKRLSTAITAEARMSPVLLAVFGRVKGGISMWRSTVLAMVSIVASGAIACAATLDNVSGRVLVNTGNGYAAAQTNTALKTGDQVFATKDSAALVIYDNGCRQRVEAGEVITVQEAPECVVTENSFNGSLAGTGIVAGLTPGAIAGGVAVAAGVTGATILIIRQRNSPASP